MPPKTERFEIRFEQKSLDKIDSWRAKQSDFPSRSDAVRRLIDASLDTDKPQVKIGNGERLIIMMLCDMYKTLKIDGYIDTEFVAEAILGGHYWALEWKYNGLFQSHQDSQAVVSQVVEILDMWSFIEEGYKKLSDAEKAQLIKETEPFGSNVQFFGFDGNNEIERLGIASFLISKLHRFTTFKGRDLNSHRPTTDTYNRMLTVFLPIRATLIGKSLSASEIVSILKERTYSVNRK